MGDKQVKRLRKQLRNVVQEALPTVLTLELVKAGHDQLRKEVDSRLNAIDAHLRDTLKAIDDRSKDTMSYLLRSVKPVANSESTPNDKT